MSPVSDDVQTLTSLAAKAFRAPFGGVLQIEIDGDGAIIVDGRASPPSVTPQATAQPPAASGGAVKTQDPAIGVCIVRGRKDILRRAFESERQFVAAYVSGRLAICGDMSVLARAEMGDGRSPTSSG